MITDVKSVVKNEADTFKLILLFLPIDFITYSPYTQWQLYFQRGHKINTGFILVAINLVGILASFVYKKLNKRKISQFTIIIFVAFLAAVMIILSITLTSLYYLSILFFLLHIAFYDIRLIAQDTILQLKISTETSRATIISVNNALEAAVYVVILAINGYIFDHFDIGVAWGVLAITGTVLFLIALIIYHQGCKQNYNNLK
ncbi:permease [Lactobacillus sp. ESL0677]|uniref:permease n=1 Tax=Lactobacillus sp. ESL0677 TaxID=2983208 RepID=UPI0023F81B41|nr:permease [Lactobacillus sp. ESL0677]WEV37656.1 permease [Lactobacillus sp. ESL0677]